MDENETLPGGDDAEVIGRLRAFGAAPLDPGLAARTVERLREARGPALHRLPLKVLVAAAIGAFAFGGLGLAAADALPPPVQDVAHSALDPLGVHVPPGHDRYNDPVKCPGGPYRNHGAYVRTHKNDPNAGQSPCGKPVKSVNRSDANKGSGKDDKDAGGRPEGAGPPPWAHGNKNKNKDKAEKNDDKTEHKEPAVSTTSTSAP